MSGLRPPRLGPIVGHVTHETARIWIRGEDPADEGSDIAEARRTVGVIAIRDADRRYRQTHIYYFRLHREYDRTGFFTFGVDSTIGSGDASPKLEAGKTYEVRVGTLSIDDPAHEAESIDDDTLSDRLPAPRAWLEELTGLPEDSSVARFTTAPKPDDPQERLSFLLGSCRYPGLLWKAKHADKIFGAMLEEAMGRAPRDSDEKRGRAHFILMVGDQIYADMLNRHVPFGLADTFEEFQDRYLTAFGSRNMRKLLRHVPTYMILDDHEIEDNWSQDRIADARGRHAFNLAINAYMSYQWLHGPRNYGKRLFYDFEHGGYPFFVLDERTQRFKDDLPNDLTDNHLLGRPSLSADHPSQLDIFRQWLTKQQANRGNAPKFVVSASVFVPNPITARDGRVGDPIQKAKWKEESDSWAAYPTTRRAVLRHVVSGGPGGSPIQNVVFLSGDIHCANVAQMVFDGFPGAADLRAYSITSSAFYWPFPFADGEPSNFVHDSRDDDQKDTFDIGDGATMDYRAWNFTQEDNFTRIDVDPVTHRMRVVPYGDDGRRLDAGGIFGFGGKPLGADLELAPWVAGV